MRKCEGETKYKCLGVTQNSKWVAKNVFGRYGGRRSKAWTLKNLIDLLVVKCMMGKFSISTGKNGVFNQLQ